MNPPVCIVPPPVEENKMNALELADKLSEANKEIDKLRLLNSWQASEINLFSKDLKESNERRGGLVEFISKHSSTWAKQHKEIAQLKEKLAQYESIVKLRSIE